MLFINSIFEDIQYLHVNDECRNVQAKTQTKHPLVENVVTLKESAVRYAVAATHIRVSSHATLLLKQTCLFRGSAKIHQTELGPFSANINAARTVQ